MPPHGGGGYPPPYVGEGGGLYSRRRFRTNEGHGCFTKRGLMRLFELLEILIKDPIYFFMTPYANDILVFVLHFVHPLRSSIHPLYTDIYLSRALLACTSPYSTTSMNPPPPPILQLVSLRCIFVLTPTTTLAPGP